MRNGFLPRFSSLSAGFLAGRHVDKEKVATTSSVIVNPFIFQ